MERVTDIHIHVQPWDELKPGVLDSLTRDHKDHFDYLVALMNDPSLLIEHLDRNRIWRAGLINYPSPDVMGFTDRTNQFAADYARHNPERLLPFGGIHPRFTDDPAGAVDRLIDMGIRCLKIHPPHQVYAANAYTEGLDNLAAIYRKAEDRGLPVMIHTGTSVFPGARCKYGNPMEIDDVAIDFPDLRIIMAHGGRPLWMDEAFFVVRRHKNVWLELSGIPPKKLLEYFPRLPQLEGQILWGTDWPSPGVKDLRVNLDQFLSLPLTDEFKQKVAVDTPLAFFPNIGNNTD